MGKVIKIHGIRKVFFALFLCFLAVQVTSIAMTGHYFSIAAMAADVYPLGIDKEYEKFAYNFYSDIVENNVSESCIEILDGTLFSSYGLEGTMTALYNALKTIGIALLTTYFLLELMDKVTREQFDVETLIRMLIKFIIAKTLIMDNGITILKAFLKIGNGMAATLGSTAPPAGTDAFLSQIAEIIQDNNMIMDIVIGILAVIPWLISKLVGLVIQAACYGRLIDIVVRGGFAPIGCAGMVQEGFSGHGIRYLKKYFGSILQGAVIMGMLYACASINASIMSAMFSNMHGISSIGAAMTMTVQTLVVGFTEIMCIIKSNQIANEIAGV